MIIVLANILSLAGQRGGGHGYYRPEGHNHSRPPVYLERAGQFPDRQKDTSTIVPPFGFKGCPAIIASFLRTPFFSQDSQVADIKEIVLKDNWVVVRQEKTPKSLPTPEGSLREGAK